MAACIIAVFIITSLLLCTPSPAISIPCGANRFCYYTEIYPISGSTTSNSVTISSTLHNIEDYHEIHTQIIGNRCYYPSISVSFEEIDFSDPTNEYFDIFDNDGNNVSRCTGTQDHGCDTWINCLNQYSLGIKQIEQNQTYVITVRGSDSLTVQGGGTCYNSNIYSLHVEVTMECSNQSPESIANNPCYFEIVSNDHPAKGAGWYFNFIQSKTDCILGSQYIDNNIYNVWYSGDGQVWNVKLWRECYGTDCSGQGRKDLEPAPGDWQVGEYVTFSDTVCQCTAPTANPTSYPTTEPTTDPTFDPTFAPTFDPTLDPTSDPTKDPTNQPTANPSTIPTIMTKSPTSSPSKIPSDSPTTNPSKAADDGNVLEASTPTQASGCLSFLFLHFHF